MQLRSVTLGQPRPRLLGAAAAQPSGRRGHRGFLLTEAKRKHCGNCSERNKHHEAPAGSREPAAAAAECSPRQAALATQEPAPGPAGEGSLARTARLADWPRKSDLYILRSDGFSCTRETVEACGSLTFAHPSSQQHLLIWKTPPRCVMLLKKLGSELRAEFLEVLRYLGEERGMRVLVEPHEYRELEGLGLPYLHTYSEADLPDLNSFVDFVACLGGDGLILHASLLFKRAIPPIISFKLGSLGFLTCHEFKNFRRHLAEVIDGYQELASCKLLSSIDGSPIQGVYITLRMRLLCTIVRQGEPSSREEYEVLNEVVVSRGANPFLTKIEVYEHDTLITKVQADGVMLATPTGSTAYNVAAGGSMVHPNVPAIMFTPICPHSLSFRPVILPDYSELEFRISQDARSPALVCLDGKVFSQLQIGDSVHVRMSMNPVPTINNMDQTTDWFNSIERCFHWNERLEQRRLGPMDVAQPLTYFASDDEDTAAARRAKAARAAAEAAARGANGAAALAGDGASSGEEQRPAQAGQPPAQQQPLQGRGQLQERLGSRAERVVVKGPFSRNKRVEARKAGGSASGRGENSGPGGVTRPSQGQQQGQQQQERPLSAPKPTSPAS